MEAVVQDDLERRRFYIRYKTVERRRAIARTGFRIGNITIPAETADVSGFLPNVPHYMEHQDCVDLLSTWGTLTKSEFVCDADTGVRCGGFRFELDLYENKRLPNRIKVLNDIILVTTKDDHKLCSYCDTLGHIRRHCRKRELDLVKRANEMREEQQTNLGLDHEMLDTSNDGQQQRQEQEYERQEQERLQQSEQELGLPPPVHPMPLNDPPKGSSTHTTAMKRTTPVNGHSTSQKQVKRPTISSIYEELLKDLPNMDDEPVITNDVVIEEGTEVIDEERYAYYVGQRRAFAKQASCEVVAAHYPSKSPAQLLEEDWEAIQPFINTKFRELLVEAFPQDHLQMNKIYEKRKRT